MDHLPDPLAPLAAHNQWITWAIIDGKKIPTDHRTGYKVDAHSPQAWTDAFTAIDAAKRLGQGVGFVFTTADPFWFLDIDKCLQESGNWSPLAMTLIGLFPGAAIEVSTSGKGLHLFGTGAVPEHACKNTPLGIELYTEGRFVALTGDRAMGWAATDGTTGMQTLVPQYFPANAAITGEAVWTTEPVPEWSGPIDDAELISMARKSKSSADKLAGSLGKFEVLWTNNEEALAELYPPLNDRDPYDRSTADAALAQSLAFWTGKNADRMSRIMWQSDLVRDKWQPNNHKKYLTNTILNAISLQRDVYSKTLPVGQASPAMGNVDTGPEVVNGYMYLGVTQQIEHFDGCVYVQDQHKIFTPSGELLKPEQFNATYGGYVFQLESNTSGKTTRKAFEAFTESQVIRYPKAVSTCFRPEQPSGTILQEEGRGLVNIYVPIKTKRIKGDPAPFLQHLLNVLPDERDRTILLSYMAACIQHKGIKFQWCPLLQGAPGNGKTLFTRCVAFAIGRKYIHFPKADDIDNKFNGWLAYKLFIGIEDIYVPDNRREVMQALLPMITNDQIEVQAKGQNQYTGDNRANFILNSNYKEAIQKTGDDRRFAVFFTAQQSAADIKRDGMGGDYFPNLYNWLNTDGYAVVADYLENYSIPDEMNPATICHRAPETSTTAEAVRTSLGMAEQIIQEAIDLEEYGFRCDLVCTKYAGELLRLHGKKLSPQKVAYVLTNLGYIKHPALYGSDGKLSIDGVRRRLYVKRGSLTAGLTTPNAVAETWKRSIVTGVTPCPTIGGVHI